MPKTVTKTPTRTKGGRNAPRRPVAKPRRELPIMPLTVGGVFLVVFVVLVVLYRINTPALTGQPVANIRCDNNEQLAVHYHAHIDLIYKGAPATVPAQVGITGSCLYWMHTHQTTGIVHIEAPKDSASRKFTLGDFFAVWNQPLNGKQVATFKLNRGDQIKVWVDGKPYTGDPARVVMKSHTQVVVEIGPTFTDPPPKFDWTSSAATQEAGTGG